MQVVDTDVLIDVQRGHPPAILWFSGLPELPLLPGLVVMEMIQDARNTKEVKQALKMIAPFSVVWPTVADCQRALTAFTNLHLSHGLGLLDSLIGACVIGLGAELCTFNVKHYQMIPGLVTVQPYTR